MQVKRLLLLLVTSLLLAVILFLRGLGLLSPDTTRTSSTKWRCERKVDVLLGVETDDERRDVDDLLANAAKENQYKGSRITVKNARAYRMWRCLIRTRAWWIDLARPSL